MAEYIERKKVEKMLDQLYDGHGEKWCNAIDAAIMDLTDIPAADVRPERHGEWLVSGECYECSECGGGSTVNTNPYCWKCGAVMDGKDGESDG